MIRNVASIRRITKHEVLSNQLRFIDKYFALVQNFVQSGRWISLPFTPRVSLIIVSKHVPRRTASFLAAMFKMGIFQVEQGG